MVDPVDCGNDGLAYGGRKVVVPPGGWCDGVRRDMSDQGIYSEMAVHHFGASGFPSNI